MNGVKTSLRLARAPTHPVGSSGARLGRRLNTKSMTTIMTAISTKESRATSLPAKCFTLENLP